MKTHRLLREQFLQISINEAWSFFSSPANLSKITPGDMSFEITNCPNEQDIYSGMLIAYKIRPLFNMPVKWVTEIKQVNAPYSFTDVQLKGPYSLWEHTHTFISVHGGVKMTDDVKYALPLGIIGDTMHTLFVKKRLEDIFNFREKTLNSFFNNN